MPEQTSGDLRLTGVTKSYDSFTAVDQLDLVIPRGSFFALLGPLRVWQDHDATDGRWARPADDRPDLDR